MEGLTSSDEGADGIPEETELESSKFIEYRLEREVE